MKDRPKEILAKFPSWCFSVLTAGIILWLTLSSSPFGDHTPRLFPGADKVAHALMFGFLTIMLCFDKWRKRNFSPLSGIYIAIAIGISSLFGVGIEFLQDYMHAGRAFEVPDMVADIVGAISAGLICYFLQPKLAENND